MKRNGIYYLRKVCPPALRAKLQRREWLYTSDDQEARQRRAAEAMRIEQELHQARLTMISQSSTTTVGEDYTEVPPEQWTLPHLLNAWGGDMTPLDLEAYREAEVAVARFAAVLGDGVTVKDITEATLRRFREKLSALPHQRGGQALDRRAVDKSLKALRMLLAWEREGEKADR